MGDLAKLGLRIDTAFVPDAISALTDLAAAADKAEKALAKLGMSLGGVKIKYEKVGAVEIATVTGPDLAALNAYFGVEPGSAESLSTRPV